MKISVIIPLYNCEKYIHQTLDGLLCQTLKDLEVIIFLDACTDKSESVIAKYMASNPKLAINLIKSDKNRGPSFARNACIKSAVGEYIHFMDADDFIGTDFYEKMYFAAINSDSDIACANLINERVPATSVIHKHKIIVSNTQDRIDYTMVDKCGNSQPYIIKRSFWKKNRFKFPEDMYHNEDLATMPFVVASANRLVLVPGASYIYKWRQNSLITDMGSARAKLRNNNYKKAMIALNNFYSSYNLMPSQKQVIINRYKLFGRITISHRKWFENDGSYKIYFLNMLIIRISPKTSIERIK